MDINYTYRDEDRPIERAEIKTSFDQSFYVEIEKDIEVRIGTWLPHVDLTKDDWKDFTDLVNRINKQINRS